MTHKISDSHRFRLSNQYTCHKISSNYLDSLSPFKLTTYNKKRIYFYPTASTSLHVTCCCPPPYSPKTQSSSYPKSTLKSSSASRNPSPCSINRSRNDSPRSIKRSRNQSPSKAIKSSPHNHFGYNTQSPEFVTCVAPLTKNYIKWLSPKSNPSRRYASVPNTTTGDAGEPYFVICEVPFSSVRRITVQRAMLPAGSTKMLTQLKPSEQFISQDCFGTGDTTKPYFGIWEAPCLPLRPLNIIRFSSPCEPWKPKPSSSPVSRSVSPLRQSSPRPWSSVHVNRLRKDTYDMTQIIHKCGQKPLKENKLYISQLYSNDHLWRKGSTTSSRTSRRKIIVLPQDFRKRRLYLYRKQVISSHTSLANLESRLQAEFHESQQNLYTRPRSSRNRDLHGRQTPWMLSSRRSQLRCFELNLSPERLFKDRGSPSASYCCYCSRVNSPDRKQPSVSQNFPPCLSCSTVLRRIPCQTRIALARSLSRQLGRPKFGRPTYCCSPCVYSSRNSSKHALVSKLIANNEVVLLCLQKRFKKFVGNILMYFCYAYYFVGSFIYL